jgi:TolB protein
MMRTPILSAAILTSYAVLMSASGAVPPAVAPGVMQDQRFEMSLIGRPGQPPHIAVPPFTVLTPDQETQDSAKLLTEVLTNDLKFEREFDVMPAASFASIPSAQTIEDLPYDRWTQLNADYVALGSVQKAAAGQITVEVRVVSIKERRQVYGRAFTGGVRSRRLAHGFSDEIHKSLRGVDGVALTRIVFASTRDAERVGKTVQERTAKEIYIMDYDGANQQRVTADRNLNIAPTWCPNGQCIAYTSYKSGFQDIYVQNVFGQIGVSRPARGTDVTQNSLPAFSPDGTRLAFSSTRDGRATDIFVVNRDGSGLRQITNNQAIDNAPAWSPAGNMLAFVSDRTGSPKIYTMSPDGGPASIVPSACSRCDRPTWGPGVTGLLIAYTSQTSAAGHDIEMYDYSTQQIRRLTNGEGTNESPSFSPNGRHVVFFTSRWGNLQLAVVDIDGKNVRRLTELGNNTYPSWSGFQK